MKFLGCSSIYTESPKSQSIFFSLSEEIVKNPAPNPSLAVFFIAGHLACCAIRVGLTLINKTLIVVPLAIACSQCGCTGFAYWQRHIRRSWNERIAVNLACLTLTVGFAHIDKTCIIVPFAFVRGSHVGCTCFAFWRRHIRHRICRKWSRGRTWRGIGSDNQG
jgi:hypothetical protein